MLRRATYPIWLAARRLRRRAGLGALVLLGVAAGAGAFAAVLGGSLVAEDRSLAREFRRLDPSQQPIRATWGGIAFQHGEPYSQLDRAARRHLRPLAATPPFAVMLYRQTRIRGTLVTLGAIEGLERWVELRTGRLPRTCRPERCEVVQVDGAGQLPSAPGLRLVRVGSGRLVSSLPLGIELGSGAPTGARSARIRPGRPQSLLVLAGGVEPLAELEALDFIYRTYSWVVPLAPGSLHPWRLDSLADAIDSARVGVEAASDVFTLAAPIDQLQEARVKSRVAARRLLLIGGTAAALLLVFALLAASGARRDAEATSRRLAWFGGRRWQVGTVFAAEACGVAVVGVAAGWTAGSAVAAAVADAAGSPAWAVLRHSVLAAPGLAAAAVVAAAAGALLLGSLALGRLRLGALTVSAVDVAALGALGAVVLALVRGGLEPESIAEEGGTGVVLLLLPGLVALVAAVVTARLLHPALRLLERLSRRSSPPLRLAALSLARNPGRSAIAVAFLAVSVGLALFAAAYRSTLTTNQADQAGFAVPLDFTLSEDFSQLVPPLAAAPVERYRELGPGVEGLPVIRLYGDVTREGETTSAALLGLHADGLPRLRSWRGGYASLPREELARRIRLTRPVALRGLRLPRDSRALALPVELEGDSLRIAATVETRRADFEVIPFADIPPGKWVLWAPLPPAARGGKVVGLTFDLGTASEERVEHISESGPRSKARGRLALGRLRSLGPHGVRPLGGYGGWIGVAGLRPAPARDAVVLRYLVSTATTSRFRPRQPAEGIPVPVLATPALARAAGPGGILPVEVVDQRVLTRVVGTVQGFPTVADDFLLADWRWLAGAMNAEAPGSAVPSEVWVRTETDAAAVERVLGRPPFDLLELTSRRGVLADLRGDPLARASLIALAAAALVALALALAGLVLSLLGDLRDERGELRELESQGATPGDLRRHLRLRALLVAAAGLLGGIGTGAALSALVVDVVALTAGAESPQPPLLLDADWPLVGAGLAGYAGLAAALVGAITWSAFRAETVRPVEAPA